jgi:DNA-binding XRE family transcriptional regulator
MLDQKQIRAARALLDWTQETLAERSGVARATIKNVESGATLPRLETANALQRTLEESGVEFLPSSGVRMKDRMVQVLEGPDSYRRLLDDVFTTALKSGTGIIIAPANPKAAMDVLGDYLNREVEKRREAGIKQRLLIPHDDLTLQTLTQPIDTYRILPEEYYSPYPLYVYGDKMALVSMQEPQKVIVINDQRFAEATRKLFEFIWDRTEMPSHKAIAKAKAAG